MLKQVVFVLCVCLAHSVPMKKRTSGLPSNDQTAGITLDAGLVGSCMLPNTSFCDINYEVPANIARIAGILDQEVQALLGSSDPDDECVQVDMEDQCARRFPRCSAGEVTLMSATDCSNRLTQSCPAIVANRLLSEGRCAAEQTHANDECREFSTHDAGGFQFRHCNISADTLLTSWMLELIKMRDMELHAMFDSPVFALQGLCQAAHARHVCQVPGECRGAVGQEQRFVVVNSNQQCSAARDCYPDALVDVLLEDLLSCSEWPSEVVGMPSPTAELTESSGTAATTVPSRPGSSKTPPTPGLMTLASLPASGHTLTPQPLLLLATAWLLLLLTVLL